MTASSGYVLSGNITELERVRLQAQVWRPAAERFLDAIGVRRGWRCADLGCGPIGIVAPLSERVGPEGCVVATDIDTKALDVLRRHGSGMPNLSVIQDDAYASQLIPGSFDLVHVRYVFSPVGREDQLLASLLSLVRPGGIVAAEETDTSSWKCIPASAEWSALLDLIRRAFRARGGDFDFGQRLYSLFRKVGLQKVQARAEILCPGPENPYRRVPILFGRAMREFILQRQLTNAAEFDELLSRCEEIALDPDRLHMTFTTVQVWGEKRQ